MQAKDGQAKLGQRLSIVLPSANGGGVRLVITPGTRGHQVTFLGADAAATQALRHAMPEIHDAVAKLPISVSDIKVMADEANKLSKGSENAGARDQPNDDELDRRKRVQRRKGAQS